MANELKWWDDTLGVWVPFGVAGSGGGQTTSLPASAISVQDSVNYWAQGSLEDVLNQIGAKLLLTAKRGTVSIDSSATPTPNVDNASQFNVLALAQNATFGQPVGSPQDGDDLTVRVKDNGTARTLAWHSIYNEAGDPLPTTTVVNETLYVQFKYNASTTKWDCLRVSSAAEVPPVPPTGIVHTFTGDRSGLDDADTGEVTEITYGTWGQSGGKAYATVPGSMAVWNAGTPNHTITVIVNPSLPNGLPAVMGRYEDHLNYFFAFGGTDGITYLFNFEYGNWVELDTYAGAPGAGDEFGLIFDDDEISVTIDGVVVIGPVTSTARMTATKAGIKSFGEYAGQNFDDVNIIPTV